VTSRKASPRRNRNLPAAMGLALLASLTGVAFGGSPRPRPRDLGVIVGILPPGPNNAITDVAGVLVGHATLIAGENVRTGVTVILPHPGNLFQEKVPAAIHVGNGFGKLTGVTQVRELGTLETPIALTGTLSTWKVADALAEWTLARPGNAAVTSVNPVVGECNDSYLSDPRQPVGRDQVLTALTAAAGGPVQEGCVGAGTGTRCLGWKGGIGTASRKLPPSLGGWTTGVLVQTNFAGILTVAGVPVGVEMGRYTFRDELTAPERGSCMVVIATDAPLDARQLGRLAARTPMGLARTGAFASNGSGDYAIAFSTSDACRVPHGARGPRGTTVLADDDLSPLFLAVVEATEEAVLDSLFAATTTKGIAGHEAEALPVDRVLEILRRHLALRQGTPK